MGVAGGVRRHVASKTNSGDNPRWRFIFFGKNTSLELWDVFGDFEFKIDEIPDYLLYFP